MQEEENKDADIPTVVETVPEAQQKNEPKKHGKKKKTRVAAKQEVKEEEIITDEDFGYPSRQKSFCRRSKYTEYPFRTPFSRYS